MSVKATLRDLVSLNVAFTDLWQAGTCGGWGAGCCGGKSVNGTLRVEDAVNVAFTANDAPEPTSGRQLCLTPQYMPCARGLASILGLQTEHLIKPRNRWTYFVGRPDRSDFRAVRKPPAAFALGFSCASVNSSTDTIAGCAGCRELDTVRCHGSGRADAAPVYASQH